MLKTSEPSYKTRGLSNGGAPSVNRPSTKNEAATTNSYIIYSVIGVGVLLLLLLYLTFGGGSSFRGQSIIVGQERISQLSEEKRQIPIYDKYVNVLGQKIFYRECLPIKEVYNTVDLLFLHGAKYSSITWKGLGTLQIFASFGYKSVAVDLPGFGLSKKDVIPYTENRQRIAFIEQFVNNIGLRKVVIIAPSASGDYAIPLLMASNSNNAIKTLGLNNGLDFDLYGMVAIAPTGVEQFSKIDYQKVKIPVLFMWGERDRTDILKQARFYLPNIPDMEEIMVEKAQHAAFVGNPQAFHSYILKFLQERCKLTKADYDENFEFGDDWDWDNTYDDTFSNSNYDLGTWFDSYTSDRSYDFDDDSFLFDNHFDSISDTSYDNWVGSSDDTMTNSLTSISDTTSDDYTTARGADNDKYIDVGFTNDDTTDYSNDDI